jgi:hypothetical protein
MEGVVLRSCEHVEAQHGLEQRRVREADALDGVGRQLEADRNGLPFWRRS